MNQWIDGLLRRLMLSKVVKSVKDGEQDPVLSDRGRRSGSPILDRLFPKVFERMILEADDDEQRTAIAERFGRGSLGSYKPIEDLIEFTVLLRDEGRADDADVLFHYAKIVSSTFLERRSDQEKHGLAIDLIVDGKAINTKGYALNEGVVEWLTLRTMEKAGLEAQRDAYVMEVALAEKLIELFGQDLVLKASFGGFEEYADLVYEVDRRFGDHAFMTILALSDSGQWRSVFQLLASPRLSEDQEEQDD